MKTHTVNIFSLVIAAVLSLGLTQGALAKGPPNKVEVTDADPGELFQGQEDVVTVTGSGFDDQSDVSYLVTGTTDASQVEVISVEYISDTELKTRIRPKDNALPTDYDIEVRTSSGRKGKGTTLFRVRQAETACAGSESKDPTIAYLTAFETIDGVNSADIFLSSDSGCDRYLLVAGASQHLPNTPENSELNRFITSAQRLRIATYVDRGFVTWMDDYQTPWTLMGIGFETDGLGNVEVDPGGPQVIYQPSNGLNVGDADVRFDDAGELELVVYERDLNAIERQLSIVNALSGSQEILFSGPCPLQDGLGDCFEIISPVTWDAAGDQVYFGIKNSHTLNDTSGVAVLSRNSGSWTPPQLLLLQQESLIRLFDVSNEGLLLYDYWEVSTNRGGKVTGSRRVYGILDPLLCAMEICMTGDGIELQLPISEEHWSSCWTRTGGALIFEHQQAPNSGKIRSFPDPLDTGTSLLVVDDAQDEFDAAR